MKVLIIDPALHSMGGHHHNAVLKLNAELSSLNVDHSCLGSAHADAYVVQTLKLRRCFTRSIYGRSEWTSSEFAQSVADTHSQLAAALRWQWSRPDLLVLPCCDQILALALARYLRRPHLRSPPHILLWLLYAPDYRKSIDDPSTEALFAEYRQAFSALRASIGDDCKITVFCETKGMADAYRHVVGLEIKLAPGPNLVRGSDALRSTRRGSPPTIACIGHANAPKGYRMLPGAIERVLRQRPDVHFAIHGMVGEADVDRDTSVFEALSNMGPLVTVENSILSHDDYLSWLLRADLILLPYDPLVYRTRGSGVFTEATTLGIPVIATRGCGFAQTAFEEGRAVEIAEYDCEGISKAVLNGLNQLEKLTARARLASATQASDGAVNSILQSSLDEIRLEKRPSPAGLLRRLLKRA